MRVFARNFLYHKPFWEGIGPTLGVTFFMLIISSIIAYKLTKPFDTVLKRLKNGGEKPSHEEKIKCISSYNKIKLLIFVVHFVGFLGGQVGVALIDMATGKTQLAPLGLTILSLHSISVAAVFSLMTLYSFDELICAPARELLEIRDVKGFEKYKHKNVDVSLGALFYATLFFSIMNLIFITVGMIVDPAFIKTVDPIPYYLKGMALAVAVSVLVSGAPYLIYIRGLKKRIKDSSELVVSTGERGDLTSRINIVTIDDFGILVSNINTLMDYLSEMVISLKSGTDIVNNSASTLTDVSGSAINALQQLRNALQNIQSEVGDQNELIANADVDMDTLITKIDAVQKNIVEQSSSVQEGSAAISQMIANIASVADLTQKADDVSEKLSKSSAIGNESISNAMSTFALIQKSSAEVQNIIKVIENISSQTNLLAMNAAIEAAHAGDVGKGFAVVADEVRSLAASSTKSANDIQTHIKDMVEKINSGVQAMNSAGGAFQDIATQVGQNHELTKTIAAAMEEQRTGAEEILKTTTNVVDSMQSIKSLADEETEKASNLQDAMKKVVESSRKSTQVVANCLQVSEELAAALNQVEGSTTENKEAVKAMKEKIDVFKI